MTETRGSYSVVRYTADTARKEPRNVGIIAWSIQHIELRIDPSACQRVVSENPRLDVDALSDLDEYVRQIVFDQLSNSVHFTDVQVQSALQAASTYFLAFTEPRYMLLGDDGFPSIAAAIDRLIERLVVPMVRTAND